MHIYVHWSWRVAFILITIYDQLAKLSPVDMKVISNMQLLAGSPENKTKSGSFSLKFDTGKVLRKKKRKNE